MRNFPLFKKKNMANLPPIPKDLISAQRIRFVREIPAGTAALATFSGPETYYAVAEPISPENLLLGKTQINFLNEFYFLFLQSGSVVPFEWQKQAEQWLSGVSLSPYDDTYIEFNWKSDRILWRPGQAMVQGSQERVNELLVAIVDFAFYETRLRRLEKQVQEDLAIVQSDIPLTHAVVVSDLKRQPHVNEMTYRATTGRMQFVQIESNLGHGVIHLSGQAKRIASELALLAEAFPRLEILDDQLECLGDLYELANDRLTEFKYYRNETLLEWVIIVLLILEVIVMFWEGIQGSFRF